MTELTVCVELKKYCLELLHEFGMLGCKPVNTPLELKFVIYDVGVDKDDSLLENITEYSYILQNLSQFMHSPRKSHLNVAFRVL